MTATTKPGQRRVLSIHPDETAALQAAGNWHKDAADVLVTRDIPGTTTERPWAVTAASMRKGLQP
jgi:hypothetical protein